MLVKIVLVLLALWILGFSMSVGGPFIHALLVIAIALFLFDMVGGRRGWA